MSGYENMELSVYMTSGEVESRFADPNDLSKVEAELAFLQKHLRLSKVYVEFFRGDCTDNKKVLLARDFFAAHGIRTAAGMMPTSARYTKSGRMICFTDPATAAMFDERMSLTTPLRPTVPVRAAAPPKAAAAGGNSGRR